MGRVSDSSGTLQLKGGLGVGLGGREGGGTSAYLGEWGGMCASERRMGSKTFGKFDSPGGEEKGVSGRPAGSGGGIRKP